MSAGSDVFISYSRSDQTLADELVQSLRGAGLQVWWDRDLPDGGRFREEILEAVETTRAVVVLWSKTSVESPWIAQEALIGLDRNVLVPLMIGNPDIPPGLGALQAMRIPEAPEERREFMVAFATALNRILASRVLPKRPRGLLVDVSRYNRLSILKMLAWSLLLAGASSLLTLLAAYGSGDMANAVFTVGVPSIGFFFAARWAVGTPRTKVFVRPEPFFSGRMIAVLAIAVIVEIAGALLYEVGVRQQTQPGALPNLSFQGRMLFTSRSLGGAVFLGLLCAPLIRAGFSLAERLGRRRGGQRRPPVVETPAAAATQPRQPDLDAPAPNAERPALRLLLMLGLGLWTIVLAGLAVLPGGSLLDATTLPARTQFNDCGDADWCPAMVVVPGGRGVVGSDPGEPGHTAAESPRREVAVKALAIGRNEVTIGQWSACVAAAGCSKRGPLRRHPGLSYPVAGVSWKDAQEYVRWLSRRTGKTYRLLSEAEWEYAARGGSATAWFWGADPLQSCQYSRSRENSRPRDPADPPLPCRLETDLGRTRAGSYRPNPYGLFDMAGNVEEWVDDCWNPSHDGAPPTGEPRREGACAWHVLKGGAADYSVEALRPANRRAHNDRSSMDLGFRVARELP